MIAPAGFRLPTPTEVDTGPALLDRTVLYYWPGDSWVRGMVSGPKMVGSRSFRTWSGMVPAPRWSTRCSMSPWPGTVSWLVGPAVPDALAGPLLKGLLKRVFRTAGLKA